LQSRDGHACIEDSMSPTSPGFGRVVAEIVVSGGMSMPQVIAPIHIGDRRLGNERTRVLPVR
jgi:hypothetical protein